MDTADLDLLRDAITQQRHAVVRGRLPSELQLPQGAVGLRARCDGDRRPLGALRDVAVKSLRLLGERRLAAALEARGAPGSRRVGYDPPEAIVGAVISALNALASKARGPATLILDEVGYADAATLEVLTRVAASPGVLRVSLVMGLGGAAERPECRALVAAVLEGGGVDATAPFEQRTSVIPPDEGAWRSALRELPAEVVLTLRAAATAGEAFEVDDVVALRGITPLQALEHLQLAKESGFPVDDSGEGRLRLPAAVAEALRAAVLPTLAKRWHLELANRHARPAAPSLAAAAPPAASPAQAALSDADDPPVRAEAPRHRATTRVAQPPPVPELRADAVFAPAASTPPAPTRARSVSVPLPTASPGAQDAARAAAHLIAAGDPEGAARQLRSAMSECAGLGFPVLALEHGRHAVALLEGLPESAARRELRAELLLMLGTLQQNASGPGDAFTLPAALKTLTEARAALPEKGAAGLRARVACAIADAHVEVGDIPALDEALRELTDTTRALRDEGASVEAARLLNDQGAVHLRLGDPVKAAWFLRQSREVFAELAGSLADDDPRRPDVLRELAETDHLFGKLTLRARARPGRESDALELGREHLEAARALFDELGATRESSRVLETLGRLETRAGHPRRAEAHLQAARSAAEAAGDTLDLARILAATADLDAHEGRYAGALAKLSDALALNVEKGSALGISFVRSALEELSAKLPPEQRARAAALGEEVASAEAAVGVVDRPA